MEYLKTLTNTQLIRLNGRVWDRMTRCDGYQPFGYDFATLRATQPTWYNLICDIGNELRRRAIGD